MLQTLWIVIRFLCVFGCDSECMPRFVEPQSVGGVWGRPLGVHFCGFGFSLKSFRIRFGYFLEPLGSQIGPKISLEASCGTHGSPRWLPWSPKLPFWSILVPFGGHLGSILEGCWGSRHDFGGYWAHIGGSSGAYLFFFVAWRRVGDAFEHRRVFVGSCLAT